MTAPPPAPRFHLPTDWPAPFDAAAAGRLVERFAALGPGEARLAGDPAGGAMLRCLGGNSPYLAELAVAPPDWGGFLRGATTPLLPDGDAVVLSVGIVGATVMPHALYLHSSLMQNRMPAATQAERRAVLRFSNIEVVVALGLAGLVNMAMVAMAAASFHQGHAEVAEIQAAYHTLVPLLGGGAALVFALSLVASGFSSSIVGTMAGQLIMQDFVHFRIPLWLRRAVTMAPAFVLVGLGANVTRSLVWSQVVLSLALPVPMLALVVLTGDRRVMGGFANGRLTQVAALLAAAVVLALNALLVAQAFGVQAGGGPG